MDQAGYLEGSWEDPEVLTSRSTVAELWHRLPLHLIEDTFGHFDLRTGSQLCRASKAWKSVLSGLALLNRGMVVYRHDKRKRWYRMYCRSSGFWSMSLLDLYWENEMFLKEDSVRSFVVLSAMEEEIADECKSVIANVPARFVNPRTRNPLANIIIHKGSMVDKDIAALLQFIRATRIQTVRFVACDFRVRIHASRITDPPNPIWPNMTWDLVLINVDRFITTETNRSLAWKRLEYARTHHMCNRWMLSDFDDPNDLTPVFWPYPPEQLLWLENILDKLPISTVQNAYHAYLTNKRLLLGWPDEKLKKMGVLWNGQELDAMDCAFFAKVLNAHALTNFPKPPCQLPNECNGTDAPRFRL